MLTIPGIKKLRGKGTRREVHDGDGLYLIIQPSGAKSWASIWREPADASGRRKPGKLHLGTYTAIEVAGDPVIGSPLTPPQARLLHIAEKRKRASGVDVVAEHRQEKIKRRLVAADGERALYPKAVADYLAEKRKADFRTAEKIGTVLGLDRDGSIRPNSLAWRWRDRRVDQISRADVKAVAIEARQTGIPGIGTAGGKSDSRERRILDALGGFFRWLAKERDLPNPVAGIARPGWKNRTRTLTDSEIATLWNATKAYTPFNRIVRVLLLTGQRLGEVAELRRDELADDLWTIPGERVKNKRDHLVPLSAPVIELMRANTAFIFEGALAGRPFSGFSKAKAQLDAVVKFDKPWRLHDLRRTFVTQVAERGIAEPHIIEAVINHQSGHKAGVAGIYNRAQYLDQKRTTLGAWADHVLKLVMGAKKTKWSAGKAIRKPLEGARA